MCVLSTLCGNVDKHSPFYIYIYVCVCFLFFLFPKIVTKNVALVQKYI